ncbi:type II toxin-antitoxin system YafQ family toxin [Candidatus Uhrbacteria bacterium]|nr:type II toxin-antitoxin system YafQ family toxin [Candidatus Uhrbacteria bacterium]
MRDVIPRNRFKRDLKRMLGRGKNRDDLLAIAYMLADNAPLPPNARPHKLSGEYEGLWECHIGHDWLLIYKVTDKEVLLARTGTHMDLFE